MLQSTTAPTPTKLRVSTQEHFDTRVANPTDETGTPQNAKGAFLKFLRRDFPQAPRTGGWVVRDQSIAKTALSTFIEFKMRHDHGVFFGDSQTVMICRAAGNAEAIKVPAWMTEYIESFPVAPWAQKK